MNLREAIETVTELAEYGAEDPARAPNEDLRRAAETEQEAIGMVRAWLAPAGSEFTVASRAQSAQDMLDATFPAEEETRTKIIDAMANLFHLMDREGIEADAVVWMAKDHRDTEVLEERDEADAIRNAATCETHEPEAGGDLG